MKLFKVCPKTHRIVGVRDPRDVPRLLFPIAGFLALAWFLLRVLPKPSRAAYPCQRVAAPMAGSFLVWLAGVTGARLLFHQARLRLRQARYLTATLALTGALAGLAWGALSLHQPAYAAYTPHPANAPIGTARGLAPGRVTWVHDPAVTDWAGPNSGQRWYEHTDQSEVDNMLEWALESYTNTTTPAAAWDAIFRNFNGGAAYSTGQKVFIKINLTTSNAGSGSNCADANYNWIMCGGVTQDSIGNSPQLMHALLDQLVNVVGVAQADISIGDPTGLFYNILYTPLHNDFASVHYYDNRGTLGRTRAEFSTVPMYWSNTAANSATQDYLPVALAEATYVINAPILKSHAGAGITVTAKNHYGTLIRIPTGALRGTSYNYFNLHYWLPGDTYRNDIAMTGMGHYRPLVDLMGAEGIGGKTILYLVDAIFAGKDWSGAPSKWALSPFNNDWPSSIFLSMDPVAIDSVGFDFLSQQWADQVLVYEGVQDYLHEAAQADDPPSGSIYDPERDGIPMASLGVHEHWNNATQKQYTRNLGSGDGIELVYINSAPVAATATPTPTATFTPSITPTRTNTPTVTFTPSITQTRTSTATFTPSNTPTFTSTRTSSPTATFTPSSTSTRTSTPTVTSTPILTHEIPLVAGWNLVSFNIQPASSAIAEVLNTVAGNYSLVYAWDAAGTGTWLKYDPAMLPLSLNSLQNLDEGMGFWIKMNSGLTLTVSGSAPGVTNNSLEAGWNLVGYPSRASLTLPDVFSQHGVGNDFSLVYAYHASDTADTWKKFDLAVTPVILNDLTELAPDYGYWVKLGLAHDWDVVW